MDGLWSILRNSAQASFIPQNLDKPALIHQVVADEKQPLLWKCRLKWANFESTLAQHHSKTPGLNLGFFVGSEEWGG